MGVCHQHRRGLLLGLSLPGGLHCKKLTFICLFALMFCARVMAQAVEPLSVTTDSAYSLTQVVAAKDSVISLPSSAVYKNKVAVHLKVIPGTAPLAVRLQTDVLGPAGTNADTYFLNVLIDVDRDGLLRSFRPGLEEWVVHNIPVVVTAGQTSIVSAPEFHLGLNDIMLGPDPLHMRISLTAAPITELYWDGYQNLQAGTYQDHQIEWPLEAGKPVMPVLMQCPDEVDFAGLTQTTFDCRLAAYNEPSLNIEYVLNRLDGYVMIDNRSQLVRQVQLQSDRFLAINAVEQPSTAVVQFTALRSETFPASWRYQANYSKAYSRLSSTGVLLEFDHTVGDIVFVDSNPQAATVSPLLLQSKTDRLFSAKAVSYMSFDDQQANRDSGDTATISDDRTEPQDLFTVIENPLSTPPEFLMMPEAIENALCIVNKAVLRYGGKQVVKPKLEYPLWATPLPALPGSLPPPVRTTGPIRGLVPDTAMVEARPGHYILGNAFEYQSFLNNEHGCFSQQYKRDASFYVDLSNNEIDEIEKDEVSIPGKTIDGKDIMIKKKITPAGLGKGWHYDGRQYAGSTRSGYSPKAPFLHYYQGTPAMIRWVDAPNISIKKGKPQNAVYINYGTLSSVTWNSDRRRGWNCKSAHMMVYDIRTQKAMQPADANAIFGQLKISAKLNAEDKKHAGFLQKTFAKFAANASFTHNPLFIDLGCKAF